LNHRLLFLIATVTMLLGTCVFVSVQVLTAKGLVPSIVSVDYYDVGSVTWANITVHHTPPPALGASHYVSNIQLEINGTVQNLAQSPQSTETFSVQYSLGPNSDKYSVRARALCTVHGYSEWSNTVIVPEFSLLTAVLFIALTIIASVIAKNTFGQRRSTSVLQ
jgi:hypothetical protein